ncbi:hypothetical protein BASA60_003283 [Batrachochytrium salamandrivorans]|nr:hypothetical protein BASA60_003283 [Batrachochytrium salamandrivorans]KAH9274923.1 hypothetical protein BASA83_002635 [Batrachochytrium salamandrivorans]
MAMSPTPSDIDVDDTSASSRVSTPGSSGLPTYNEDPSSERPSTTLQTFGVPVYFQGIGANSYAVVTIAHICPSGLAGLMVNIQRKNTFPDSNQSPKSLSPAHDTYVPLCAQASTTDTKFHSAWLDASSGYLYVLYSGSTGPLVSSINTNTLDVTNLPQVNPAMRDTHSMAIVNLSSGREISSGAVYLSKTSGLWILPINDLGSKTYFSLAQFPNDYEPADITASSNCVYTAGLNTTSKDYFIQKTNAIDGKKELQGYRAPFTKFLGKLEANHHNVTMTQKPMIVCNEVVYLALVYTNGTGLVLLTFSQSPFTMLSQSSFLIPADDTVLSMSCVSVANPHSGGEFFGIAILVNTEQHDDLYTITVDESARASAPKAISKKIVVNTRDRVWSECNTIGFASESTNSTIGILSTTQSPPTRWNLDIVKNSYLEGVIPSKAICAVGYFFSSTSNDCVLCRGYRNPPTACLHRGSKGGGDHNYELDELDDLSLPLKLLAIIGSCVFLSFLIALCSYWFRCSKRNSISRQLTSSHISSMREPRCAMSDDSQKVLITPTNTTRSISTDSEKSLNMASTYIYPTKAANYDTHEYMTHDASPFTKSTPPIFRIHSYNEDNLSRMATKLISPIKYPEAIASNPKGVNAEHDLSPSRLILLSNNPMYERQVTISTLEHSLAGQSARIEEDSAAYSSQGDICNNFDGLSSF